jgi:hypothetical protein
LKDIKTNYLANDAKIDEGISAMRKRIDYAIDKIGQRDIFNVDIVETLDLASAQKRQPHSGWLREYSSVNMEAERSNYLKQ